VKNEEKNGIADNEVDKVMKLRKPLFSLILFHFYQ